MIPYDLDPSLHSGEPETVVLDDGFSPPQTVPAPQVQDKPGDAQDEFVPASSDDAGLGPKSLF